MNPERLTSLDDEHETTERPRSRELYRQIGSDTLQVVAQEKNYQHSSMTLTMADFAEVYSPEKIRHDERYVNKLHNTFERRDRETHIDAPEHAGNHISTARMFEKVFIRGIQEGRWLGNLGDDDEDAFSTRSYSATEFDDKRHRIDAFTTLMMNEPIKTRTDEIMELPLGFDVTTDGRRSVVMNKLTRQYNDDEKRPFGFSGLDYYTDGSAKGTLAMVPRYLIGVSRDDARELNWQYKNAQPVNMFSPANLVTRFKVLAEIRAQNELYEAMLPDGAFESDDEQLRQAVAYLEVADNQLQQALNLSISELTKQQVLPSEVTKAVEDAAEDKRRVLVEDYLMKHIHEQYLETRRDEGEAQEEADDAFVQIMTCAKELSEMARQGKLDKYRKISCHNHVIEV